MSDRRAALDREAMRRMVREVLRDALPEAIKAGGALRAAAEKVAARPASPAPAETAGKKPAASARSAAERQVPREEVSIQNDRDLAAFVHRLQQLLANPVTAEAIRTGRHQFTLKRAPAASNAAPARPAAAAEKILKGVVKESTVTAAAKAGTRLVIGRGVVVTPLARDKARQLGVQIERDV
jgi:hypothetical protein